MVSRYVPDMGDLIWVDFDPTKGSEQAGHRPAVVLSPFMYNNKTGMCLCVPYTTQSKGYPFEVVLSGQERDGVAGSDSNLLIVFYVQIMPDDLVMQLHRF